MVAGLLRILVVGDNPLARAGLVAMLDGQEGCEVVGQMDTTHPDQFELFTPDVVVWDGGWDTALDTSYPIAALVADEVTAQLVWASGARGILPLTIESEALALALQTIAQGLLVIDPQFVESLLPTLESTPELVEDLTPREREVVQLLAEGLSNKAMAVQLGISEHTIKFHVTAIMGKLNAQSRTEAAIRAARLGLISL